MTDAADDHERFMRLFLAHEQAIMRTVLLYVPQEADACDVVQETAVALWRRFSEYDTARPFVNWACGFARLEVRRFRRRSRVSVMLSEAAMNALMTAEDDSLAAALQRERFLGVCRDQLPEQQRRVLDGYYLQDQSVEILAREHCRSVEAIYKLLQRIRRGLLDCIERKLAEEGT